MVYINIKTDMWNHCRLIRESLDLCNPRLIFELQAIALNGSRIAVELVEDLPTLIKIMEVTHSKQEVRIAPHVKAAETPTRIKIEDIRFYSEWKENFMIFEKAEDEDKTKPISFYKKTIFKDKTIKSKQL